MALHFPSLRLCSGGGASFRRPRLQLPGRAVASAFTVDSSSRARFVARRSESAMVQQLDRPLAEYMSLPASQYSVLDAQWIERIDDNTFRCYVYRLKFFSFEICPVLVLRVDEEPYGCCIRLLSCQLQGSPLLEAQNDKFSASMVNKVSYDTALRHSQMQRLTSDTFIEVTVEIPFIFSGIPINAIESTGTEVLDRLLRIMLPRFLDQLAKDYQAWALGDSSRKALGTGEI